MESLKERLDQKTISSLCLDVEALCKNLPSKRGWQTLWGKGMQSIIIERISEGRLVVSIGKVKLGYASHLDDGQEQTVMSFCESDKEWRAVILGTYDSNRDETEYRLSPDLSEGDIGTFTEFTDEFYTFSKSYFERKLKETSVALTKIEKVLN